MAPSISTPMPGYFQDQDGSTIRLPHHMPACEGVIDHANCVGRRTGCRPDACERYARRTANVLLHTRMHWNLPKPPADWDTSPQSA